VSRLGKAILTPILLIAHPDKYSVWNGVSEGAMRKLGVWLEHDDGLSVGERYRQMNAINLEISSQLDVDLWTLDALWWRAGQQENELNGNGEDATDSGVRFGLERHLHDFLLDNWESTSLGKHWDLVEDGGDIRGYGYERVTPVGKIDLLARHRSESRWLVVELKRAQTSDDTLGQLQRYMGWVIGDLAKEGDSVEGLIVAQAEDDRLRYALKATQNIRFLRYEVDFRLLDDGQSD
jgi:hypothetical protein